MAATALFEGAGPVRTNVERAVALAARSDLGEAEVPELSRLLAETDADGFYGIVRRHVLGPMVFRRLRELSLVDALPSQTVTALKRDYAVAAMRATSLAEDLGGVLDALGAADVIPAPIKGAALAWTLYREPGCRPMSDFDLLVAPDEAERAAEALAGAGYAPLTTDPALIDFYRQHFHMVPLAREGAVAVEIHTGMAAQPAEKEAAALLDDSSEGRLLNRRARMLRPADHLAIVAAHAFSHREPSLIALADCERLSHKVEDWDGLAERVAPAYRPAAGVTLALAAGIFGAPVPENLPRQMIEQGGARALRLVRDAPGELWSRRARHLALLVAAAGGVQRLWPHRGETAAAFGVDSRSWTFPFWRAVHPLRQIAVGLRSLVSGH